MATQRESFNYLFQTKLDSWTPLRAALHRFFNDDEIALLDRRNRAFLPQMRKIFILSFENRLAQFGGLGAVMRYLPVCLQKHGERTFLLTPLHRGSSAVRKAIDSGGLVRRFDGIDVRIGNFSCKIGCFEESGADVPTFHVDIPGRFMAGENPYGYRDQEELVFDSLAFCAAVPPLLAKLGHCEHVIFHAHDWETAPIALFARCAVLGGILQKVKTLLTLNNSFDAPFPEGLKHRFFGRTFDGSTVLQSMLPFFHGPLTTVSTPYAHELRHDPLQYGFFVDHLQRLFAMNPPIGIENGVFGEPSPPFCTEEIVSAQHGDYQPLIKRKLSWRASVAGMIRSKKVLGAFGTLSPEILDDPSVPIFFMSGRLDLMQKGFDAVFHSFKRLKPGSAMLFFTPTPCSDNEDLSFFSEIADECRGTILVWPFFISSQDYLTLLKGASFLLMPSFYEPFGAANEGLLNGTPVIARATGGLLVQLQPTKGFRIPRGYATIVPDNVSDTGNAILFRESFPDNEAAELWRTLLRLPLRQRIGNPLYQSIVEAAYTALVEAVGLFADQHAYGSMISKGIQSVLRTTWEEAVEKYRAVFDIASVRGM